MAQYYPVTIPNEQNELLLAFLRQETIRDILVYLMENPVLLRKLLLILRMYQLQLSNGICLG
jgi:hypothetical protein